ncbi:hypothetical protein EDD86DRAFT_85457 [Gorgonomyces haynaldii]|nr:hypothetical protein EDD86DRAFT_85457 [Gorgonomyces haynaldii]
MGSSNNDINDTLLPHPFMLINIVIQNTDLAYNTTYSGLQWSQTVGYLFIMYGFLVGTRNWHWQILLAHAVSGIMAIVLTTMHSRTQLSGILIVNELFWIINQATLVFYAFEKLHPVLGRQKHQKYIVFAMAGFLIGFSATRIAEGATRFQFNTMYNPDVNIVEAFANVFVALGECMILYLLFAHTQVLYQLRKRDQVVHFPTLILKSFVPRLAFIALLKILLCVVSFLPSRPANLLEMILMLEAFYPIVLFYDMMEESAEEYFSNPETQEKLASSGTPATPILIAGPEDTYFEK